jgi:hemerythrin-like domain-containing protein
MTQHIRKENNVFFSRIDRLFAKKKEKELVEDLQDLERKKIWGGTHEEFHKLLFELKEIYLD